MRFKYSGFLRIDDSSARKMRSTPNEGFPARRAEKMTVKFSLWKSGKKGELLGGEFAGEGGVWDKAGVGAAHTGHSFKCWEAQSIDERFRLVKASGKRLRAS